MKIDEPKTPYVRYNVETDEVEGGMCRAPQVGKRLSLTPLMCGWYVDIPQLELGGARSPGLPTESLPESPTSGIASGPSSRRESLSSVGKNSSGRSGSVASSRSTSFSLPNDSTRTEVKAGENELVDSDVEDDESMDEEGACWLDLCALPGADTRHTAVAKHAEFVEARNRHYSKEAEAMKVGWCLHPGCPVIHLRLCRELRRCLTKKTRNREKMQKMSWRAIALKRGRSQLDNLKYMGMVLQTVLCIHEV